MTPKTTLIDVGELASWPPQELLIVDCRFALADPEQGWRDYLDGHIPGAVHASLDRDLSDLSREGEGLGRHPLPHEPAFNALLASWGWRAGMQVVCYDASSGALAAARLWWMLRLVGVSQVAVLDGGYAAWLAAGLPVEAAAVVPPPPSTPSLHYDPWQLLFDPAVLEDMSGPLIDARAAPRYRGDVEPLDRVAGHVPGALNRPFADNLGEDGRFKPAAQLRAEFEQLLAGRTPAQMVAQCGSGVTACHHLLAMHIAGLSGARLYAGSWSEWIADPSRPVARGAEP